MTEQSKLQNEIYSLSRNLYETSELIKNLDKQLIEKELSLTESEREMVLSTFSNYEKICQDLKVKLEDYFKEEEKQGNEVSFVFKKLYKKLKA